MLRKPVVLITGASGEIGHGLITSLAQQGSRRIVTLDVKALEPELARLVDQEVIGSILDTALLERFLAEYEVDLVFHLAALLSTRSEFTPMAAHQVNVEGTLHLLEFAQRQGESHGRPVVFLYPSSIAADVGALFAVNGDYYGFRDTGIAKCNLATRESDQLAYQARYPPSAACNVASITASSCAAETKPASYMLGAR